MKLKNVGSGGPFTVFLFANAGADAVIALTHMRVPNDVRLAEEVSGIDLILGGKSGAEGVI